MQCCWTEGNVITSNYLEIFPVLRHSYSHMLLLKCYSLCFTYVLCQKQGPGYFSQYSVSLRGGRSGDLFTVCARFSTPVQIGPRAYPASCIMGTGSFPGVKRPGRGADNPLPSKCQGHERIGLYCYSHCGLKWPVTGRTTVPRVGICYTRFYTLHIVELISVPMFRAILNHGNVRHSRLSFSQ